MEIFDLNIKMDQKLFQFFGGNTISANGLRVGAYPEGCAYTLLGTVKCFLLLNLSMIVLLFHFLQVLIHVTY